MATGIPAGSGPVRGPTAGKSHTAIQNLLSALGSDEHFHQGDERATMTGLTPDEFEEQKYVDYFPKLETAYKRAFDEMNGTYDRELVHAIDQQVLSESEPFYEGDGEFTVEVPDDPLDRLAGVQFGDDHAREVIDEHTDRICAHLRDQFDLGDEKA